MNEKIVNLKLTYDPESDSAYLYLADIQDGEIRETFPCDDLPEFVKGDVNLDFNASGRLKGIEILWASKVLPEELLNQAKEVV